MNTGLIPRVKRIEENERLYSRTKVEKKDEIKSLPFYPHFPAKDEVFRKAQAQMNSCIKVIERTTNFNDSPFNFLYMVASNSVKIAKDFLLDENQHKSLILSHIPSTDNLYAFHNYNALNIARLFEMISMNSNLSLTRTDLERQINTWKLARDSEIKMQRSIIDLLILLDKNRENYGLEDVNIFTMFTQALQIISRDDTLPRYVKDAVYESRIKIKPNDEMTDLYKILLSTCLRALSQNQRNQQTKMINAQNPGQLSLTYPPPPPFRLMVWVLKRDFKERKKVQQRLPHQPLLFPPLQWIQKVRKKDKRRVLCTEREQEPFRSGSLGPTNKNTCLEMAIL